MDFDRSMQSYLNFFYYIGLTSYRPQATSRNCHKFFAWTKYAQLLMCHTLSIFALISMNEGDMLPHQRTTQTIIINLFILCDMARSTSIFLQMFYFANTLTEIIGIFRSVDKCLKEQVKYRIPYRVFQREYRRTFLISTFVVALYILGFVGRVLGGIYASLASHFTKVLQVMTACTYLHIILYVQGQSFHIRQLNAVVRRDMVLFQGTVSMPLAMKLQLRHRLKIYKFVHFRLWTVSKRISEYFGYSMIALFLHAFSDVIYCAFWAYQIVKVPEPLYNIWSECPGGTLRKHFYFIFIQAVICVLQFHCRFGRIARAVSQL